MKAAPWPSASARRFHHDREHQRRSVHVHRLGADACHRDGHGHRRFASQTQTASYANNTNAGTATASYSYAGDANHSASSGSATFTIGQANATVAVTGYTGGTYDGSQHTQTVTVSGVGNDGTLYTTSLSGTNAGAYSQPWSFSNGNYNPVDESGTLAFSIGKASSTTTPVNINGGPFTYTGIGADACHGDGHGLRAVYSLTPTASYANNTNAGTATASYSYAGDANHSASSGSATFTIGQANATVAFTGYTGGTYDGSQHTQTVTVSGVGNDGTLYATSLSGTNAAHTASPRSFSNGNYNPVDESGTLAFSIGKASSTTTVNINGGPFTYTGSAQTPATVTVTGTGGLSETETASYANNTNAGTATASYSYVGDANHSASSGSATFTIGQANATVAVTGYTGGTYDGSQHTQTVTVSGVGNDGTLYATSLSGTNAGAYSQPWSFSNGNYNPVDESGTLAFSIGKASSTTTVNINGGPFTYTGWARRLPR